MSNIIVIPDLIWNPVMVFESRPANSGIRLAGIQGRGEELRKRCRFHPARGTGGVTQPKKSPKLVSAQAGNHKKVQEVDVNLQNIIKKGLFFRVVSLT